MKAHPRLDAGRLTQQYIAGRWQEARGGARFAVIDPADGSTVSEVSDGGAADACDAVEAAANAQRQWGTTSAAQRAAVLRRWCELIRDHREDLARIITMEQGKVLAEARAEIDYGASYFEWFAEEARRGYGDVIPSTNPGRRLLCIPQPVGVVAAITPWNFPHAMLARKAAAAIAAGCCVVAKPSELTPVSALALAALGEEAGLPAGVFNIVVGTDADAIGRVLTTDPRVRKLSFTGSTAVGKRLLAQCAGTVKRTSLELGGNAPFIVFEDADLEAAVEGAVAAKFRNAGQACIAANRILVQRPVQQAFAERLSARVRAIRVGRGDRPDVDMGPLISQGAVDKVSALIEDAEQRGATIVRGQDFGGAGGHFLAPMMVSDLSTDARLAREEIFGPVASVYTFDTEDEAMRLANDTPYGLAAYAYSGDVARLLRVSERLEYGMVGANEVAITGETIPFGGIKESGFGREGSRHGLSDYTHLKYVCLGGLEAA